MATPTYDLIETTTLTSAASSVTFSSITQDYRDLVLVENIIGNGGDAFSQLQLNGDTAFNYNFVFMRGDGSSATSNSNTTTKIFGANAGDGVPAMATHSFMDYSATDKHTTLLTRRNDYRPPNQDTNSSAQRWANTAAVTEIRIFTGGSDFASGSSFSLYGISA